MEVFTFKDKLHRIGGSIQFNIKKIVQGIFNLAYAKYAVALEIKRVAERQRNDRGWNEQIWKKKKKGRIAAQ